ncbi:MAG: acyl-CoA dehydrogenase family protein [Acidobacteriaceae bacterium]
MSRARNNQFSRDIFDEDHDAVRDAFRRFLAKEVQPHYEKWERAGIIPHEVFEALGASGYLCLPVPEEYGGQGISDFRFSLVLTEECLALGMTSLASGIALINDVALPYFLDYTSDAQRRRWFEGMVEGKLVTAIAMTEPSGGSDLASLRTTARLDGDAYVVNGSKTFITNGINADLVLVAAKTDPSNRHGGISLLIIERGMEGFERGRNLEKLGQHAQDTAELFFNNVRVPKENLIGTENQGFVHMMTNLPQERLSIANSAVASSRAALEWTISYTKERKAFGKAIGTFQHSRMVIAGMRTEVEIAQIFVDRCTASHVKGELTAEQAAMAKWWCTELQGRVMDQCLQLHGGYGYMTEFPIARAWADARIMRIFGGTNEIMKEIIGKAEGLSG